ncbi:hypothetical protein FB468_0910 [Leucobacter komagatae]|uniref:Uncharacterized protein n=1 Tax=Leucobacter komagatae TaxID=55969 RepID=A0A542Y4A8_9MICO|nr:hypothetical protein FB468_0910 [Leucobacter komagatae]
MRPPTSVRACPRAKRTAVVRAVAGSTALLSALLFTGCASLGAEPGYTPRTASGTIVSEDELTSATFEVETFLRTLDDGETEEIGEVRFTDLTAPVATLGVGGELIGSAAGPCFDTGLRTGGGDISVGPAEGPQTSTMPMDAEGREVAELVLLVHEQDPNAECFYRVVARAPLVWDEQ